MTKEHLNEIMSALCEKLKIRKSDPVAVHEAGLVALGIDSNAVPYGLDFLLQNGIEDDTEREFTFEGFDIRLHAPGEFGAVESISLVIPKGVDFPALAPEVILKNDSHVTERQVPDGAEGGAGGVAALRRYGR